MTSRAQCSATRKTCNPSPCDICIFFEKKYFLQKKKQTWQDAPNVRPLARPATLHLVTYVFFTKKIFFGFFWKKSLCLQKKKQRRRDAPNVRPLGQPATLYLVTHVSVSKKNWFFFKKNREDETRLMYGHSDDLQRFTLLSWAALKVPDRIFPLLARLPARGSEAEQTGERERGRGRERERESARV